MTPERPIGNDRDLESGVDAFWKFGECRSVSAKNMRSVAKRQMSVAERADIQKYCEGSIPPLGFLSGA